ncbi:hypothetical protein IM697_37260 [Streptomyces ferrugineus]|uniref:Uncharacterized protein n=1 Tax=Streptomyces ferrugineus TaxID=1413221 RepID=A0A7M2SH13_9ACTN|nr:hypothetical protein [Streptomyces ferrugineus]QOV35647.1 hypothetical protein IM697_37260 [Streptomyces ferrugineus]
MGIGVLPALGLHSQLADLESVATKQFHRAQFLCFVATAFLCAAPYFLISALTLTPNVLLIMARSLPGWIGLALLSGRIFGWRLSWVAPAVVACAVTYWGASGGAETETPYVWWEFTARSPGDMPSLFLVLGLLTLGAFSLWLTPWRQKRMREAILPMPASR